MDEESRINFVKIEDITKDTKIVNIIARIYNFSKIIDFQRKDGSRGRVVNIYISDGTDIVRLVLWDRQVAVVEEGNVSIGDVIQIVNGNIRESLFDTEMEIVPGSYTSINLVENGNYNIPALEELHERFSIPYIQRVEIKNLTPGLFEVAGTVVQTIKGKHVFYSCPICRSKMNLEGTSMKCIDHGEIEGEPVIVFSAILDDGTNDIRIVFFRNIAEKALNTNANKFASMSEEERYETIKEKLLGKDFIITGKVKNNEAFNRTEFVATGIKTLNSLEESRKLIEDIEKWFGGQHK